MAEAEAESDGRAPVMARPGQEARLPIESAEDARCVACHEISAIEAGRWESVTAFREDFFDGSIVHPESIPVWICAQAERQLEVSRYARVPVNSSGELATPVAGQVHWEVEFEWLEFLDPACELKQHVTILESGPLGRLREIARKLRDEFGWRECHAVDFIVGGVTPPESTASYSIETESLRTHEVVNIRASMRAKPRDIQELYAHAVACYGLGAERAMSQQRLELAVFITRANDGRTWRQAMTDYSGEHPEHAYNQIRNFSSDARKAYERVTHDQFRWGLAQDTVEEKRLRNAEEEYRVRIEERCGEMSENKERLADIQECLKEFRRLSAARLRAQPRPVRLALEEPLDLEYPEPG